MALIEFAEGITDPAMGGFRFSSSKPMDLVKAMCETGSPSSSKKMRRRLMGVR